MSIRLASPENPCTRQLTASRVITDVSPKLYWMNLVERDSPASAPTGQALENGDLDLTSTRRTFLKAAGFSFVGALAANCSRAPVADALPYVQQPEGIIPGRKYLYASTCGACEARCGLLVTA